MKAQELRLGNWVLPAYEVEFNPVQVGMIHKDMDIDFLPIPLTPELLEKIGFVDNWTYFPQIEGISAQEIHDIRNKELWHCTEKEREIRRETTFLFIDVETVTIGNKLDVTLPNEVYYLHQLQNLIYSLSGKELTINL